MTYPKKDPTYNPYAVLAKKKVQAKVTQNQQNQQPPPLPKPKKITLPEYRVQLRTDAVRKLTDNGFTVEQTTYVRRLTGKVTYGNMANVGFHLTINISDLQGQIDLVDRRDRTVQYVLQGTEYHVTVEESDDLSDPINPRWYSDSEEWVINEESHFKAPHVNLTKVQTAINEAKGIITTVRQ